MSYKRKKKTASGKIALYDVTAKWDPAKKQSRSTSKYLGLLNENGELVPKGTFKVGRKQKSCGGTNQSNRTVELDTGFDLNISDQTTSTFTGEETPEKTNLSSLKSVVDFGNSYLVYESIKQSKIYKHLAPILQQIPSLLSLLTYRICQPGPMYNADLWYRGSIVSFLDASLAAKISLSSSDISRYMAILGEEDIQREFFKSYLGPESNLDSTEK
jgi:hypothetical protein